MLAALAAYFGGLSAVTATRSPLWLDLIVVLTAAGLVFLSLAPPRSAF